MSKNFELMQEALREAERETSSIPESTIVFPGSEKDRRTRREPRDFDSMAQEECLKVVQRIFLGQPANIHRAIVFAGVDPGDGCSRICVESARALAANAS